MNMSMIFVDYITVDGSDIVDILNYLTKKRDIE